MKTNKVVKKVKRDGFDNDKSLSAKVVKEKRTGKPLIHQIEEDEDELKPLRPTTNSFFDEDYDADADEDDDDDDDEEWEEGDDEEYDDDDEELEEFQKIR